MTIRAGLTSFLLLLAGVSFALLMLEVAVRAAAIAPRIIPVAEGRYQLSKNRLLGYEPTPNLDYQGGDLFNYDWRGETTNLGFRSREYTLAETELGTRVAVLGDSIAAGLWVDDYDDTFPSILERSLQKSGARVYLQNYSLVGYNTRQEVEVLKDFALRFEPHIVLLEYCLNDRVRNDGMLLDRLLQREKQVAEGISAPVAGDLSSYSALFRLLRFKTLPALGFHHEAPSLDVNRQALSADTVEESLREFGVLAAQHSFKGVVAIFPHFGNFKEYAYSEEHAKIASVAAKAGLISIDLLDSFRECAPNGGANFDEYHPNQQGHRCAGKALAGRIKLLLNP